MYNIIMSNSDYCGLYNAINENIINNGDNTHYKNSYYIGLINNNPVACYKNTKNIIHVVILEKSRIQYDYILDTKKGFKSVKSIDASPKDIIDTAINKDMFLNKEPIKEIQI